ncbi:MULTISPECIES: DUF2905 domain-containing protein [Halobacillus]|uniref:DUF2905 family protein n=2 Tax=Halobacillus TaxID=45667 RepID=I0JPB8_HALH3|nr:MULTISPECIES: DUF2905 domain-containing protein [Halobacillus]ASF40023.1 DUF2905 domain-containing protein [Halobacillus halophilus]MCA1009799.1 DUF2905 domain-containing protein [Halobacillus halophilus]CCG45988.1 hypothetical protein HBHAL_3643 [Halobacillus halophilus DSM 2266]SFF52597.1 Protein of unknown function [Halobacillus alkaliphilus]
MTGFGKIFIVIGIVFIVIGLLWSFVGRLPGDLSFKKGNTTFYFPIMTSIVASIVLSLIFYIIGKIR